jgi:hypothetical protein
MGEKQSRQFSATLKKPEKPEKTNKSEHVDRRGSEDCDEEIQNFEFESGIFA